LNRDVTTELCTWIGDTIIEMMTVPAEHAQQITNTGASIRLLSVRLDQLKTERATCLVTSHGKARTKTAGHFGLPKSASI
jgi:hypothetical protein